MKKQQKNKIQENTLQIPPEVLEKANDLLAEFHAKTIQELGVYLVPAKVHPMYEVNGKRKIFYEDAILLWVRYIPELQNQEPFDKNGTNN